MTITAVQHSEERDVLQTAFQSFDQAARTLQQSYGALTARVEQMDLELAQSNDALRRQLRENEAMRTHLDGILESLSTGILVLDDAGVVTRSNAPAAEALGMTAAELCGRHATAILDTVGLSLCDRPQRIGQAVVTITQTPLKTSSGCRSGSLVLIQDVTRLCQLEERVQRKDRLAAMGEMIGRIAHEIRNPLGSVELFASMLRRDLHEQPASKIYAEQISQAVHAMDRLLENLLVYTKPARSSHAWCAAEPLILDALSLAAHAIAKTPVDVRIDLDPGIPAIWCHEGQMKQVMLNLIINAAQAMPAGGVLKVTLDRDRTQSFSDSTVCLTVSDSGPGINAAYRSRLFDPFFTTKDEGTGLGLAIVHAIVEAHHGRIDVDSVAGHGASFSIVLPHPVTSLCVSGNRALTYIEHEQIRTESGEPVLVEEAVHE
ncbi:MAG: PAS domain-containing protein [Nitrospira sp.]|nr:PAS domain-containing protein [Nitrospira sp.]